MGGVNVSLIPLLHRLEVSLFFLKKDNPAKVVDSFRDTEGNVLAVLMIYEDKKILLEVLYGPNQDSPSFYSDTVFKQIQAWNPDFSIFFEER